MRHNLEVSHRRHISNSSVSKNCSLYAKLCMCSNRVSIPGGYNDGIFLFATACRQALEDTQPPMLWVHGVLIPEMKGPSMTRISGDISPLLNTSLWRGA
jgi:hypothetical protein